MENNISGRKLIKVLLIKVFTSDILNSIVNILLPVIISIHCVSYDNSLFWWIITLLIGMLILIFNVLSIIVRKNQTRNSKELSLIYKCYNEQSVINNKTATKIFKLNKRIEEAIKEKKPLSSKFFDNIADFQTIAFTICESIHNLLKSEFGEEINCEVTLMKKIDTSTIKMVAYANNENKMPSSYTTYFKIPENGAYFIQIFNDRNAAISCLPDKESVHKNFKQLPGSEKREDNICQYVGIPVKTNKNEVELLLQVDVAKEKIFGKKESEMLLFAKNILEPYAILLHKTYERDLIFNQFFDKLVYDSLHVSNNNKG